MVMLAAYHLMLSHLCGSYDVAVGIPVSTRIGPELDDLLGYLVNTVAIRSQQDGLRSFADLLAQIRERVLDALDHRAAPFYWVVDDVNPRRATGANPLFRVGFDMDRAEEESAFQFPSIQTDEIGLSGSPHAKFELTLHVEELPGQELRARLEYAVAVIDEQTAQGWARYYAALVDAVVSDPAQPLASIGQRLRRPAQDPRAAEHQAAPELVATGFAGSATGALASVIASISKAWRDVLPARVIDVRDNFFDVGGDSLRAVALAAQLRAERSRRRGRGHLRASDDRGPRAGVRAGGRGRPGRRSASPGPPGAVAPFALVSLEDRAGFPQDVVDAYPLAAMQLGMLIELRSRPEVNSYQDSTSYRIRDDAPFDPAALARAAQLVVDRHEVLRTSST